MALERKEIDQFILDRIDSVSHLEALLLVWKSRPKVWTVTEVARRLYVEPELARTVLEDLDRAGLVVAVEPSSGGQYTYNVSAAEMDMMIFEVDETYRRELVRITSLIHSKPSAGVREFGRAFRFKKEQD